MLTGIKNKLPRIGLLLCLLSTIAVDRTRKGQAKKSSKPFVPGVVEAIYSKYLWKSRKLNIYLPEGYQPSDTTLPVERVKSRRPLKAPA